MVLTLVLAKVLNIHLAASLLNKINIHHGVYLPSMNDDTVDFFRLKL